MKIYYKTKSEIDKLRDANQVVCEVLDVLEEHCRPGVSTGQLNELADRTLKKLNATSAFLGYGHPPYPAVLCTSINEVVVHASVLERGTASTRWVRCRPRQLVAVTRCAPGVVGTPVSMTSPWGVRRSLRTTWPSTLTA